MRLIHSAMHLVGATLLSAAVVIPAFAQAPSNNAQASADPQRVAAANRLIKVQPPATMLKDTANRLAPQLPRESQAAFIEGLTDPAFVDRFETVLRNAMVKHFTTAELNALADFYSKPVAKSAMEKLGVYMADVMPFIMQEGQAVMNRLIEQEQKRIERERELEKAKTQEKAATSAVQPASAPAPK